MTYLADVFMWCWCWLAYRLVLILPHDSRPFWWLLPWAGFYGYHGVGLPWRWSRRLRR